METSTDPHRKSLPLMPTQAWLLDRTSVYPNEANLVEVVEISLPFDAATAFQATAKLMRSHEAFGLRFNRTGESWEQTSGAVAHPDQAFAAHDLSGTPQGHRMTAVSEVLDEALRRQNLSEGPIFQVHHFSTGLGSPSIVALVAHHLIADYSSMQLIVSEFFNIVSSESWAADAEPQSITQFSSLAQYAESLSNDPALLNEADYWLSNEKLSRYDINFRDGNVGHPQPGRKFASLKLDEAATDSLIRHLRGTYRATIETALVAALASSVRESTGDADIAVNLWNHGRLSYGNLDLTRTVGVMAYRYRAFVDLDSEQIPSRLLRSVQEQLSSVPRNGIGYGLLRYGANPRIREMLSTPTEGLVVNFFGKIEPATSAFFFLKRINHLSNLVINTANKPHNTMRLFGRLSDDLYLEILHRDTHKPEAVEAMLLHIRSFLKSLSC